MHPFCNWLFCCQLGVVCIKKYDIAAALICKLIRSWMSEHRQICWQVAGVITRYDAAFTLQVATNQPAVLFR